LSGPPPAPGGYSYRGLFWPSVLIFIGIIALLVNTNLIPADRLYRLGDLWPVLLVVLGLELLVRRATVPAAASTAAAALIVVLAVVGAAVYVATGPPLGSGTFDSHQPVGELSQASLEVDVGGASITVRGSSDIGNDLYRAHINYSGRTPSVSLDRSSGQVRISQNSGGFLFPSPRFTLDLWVSTKVPWSITVNAGGTTETLNLADVDVRSIALNTGGSSEDITLGPPHGSVPITVNGGGLTVHLHRPDGTAASVRVSGGAVSLNFDGRHHAGIGSLEDSSGGGPDVYEVEVSGGGCNVTMDTNSPSA
jgi:cell wall-active antibiotic response 4TMS protein YvqF